MWCWRRHNNASFSSGAWMSPHILLSFYTCTVENILTGYITAWYGNSTSSNRKALQRLVWTARHTLGGELPSLHDIYTRRRGKPGGSSVFSDTQAMDCSLCCPQADSYAVYEHAQADWGTAFSLRLSGCWTLGTDTHTAHLSVHTIQFKLHHHQHNFVYYFIFYFLPTKKD